MPCAECEHCREEGKRKAAYDEAVLTLEAGVRMADLPVDDQTLYGAARAGYMMAERGITVTPGRIATCLKILFPRRKRKPTKRRR